MGSFYSGITLGNKIVEQILEANNVMPDERYTYQMKDTPFGCKLIEYDEDGEVVGSYTTEKTETVDMSYFSDMKKDLEKKKKQNEKAKYIRFITVAVIAGLVVLAFTVIVVGKNLS